LIDEIRKYLEIVGSFALHAINLQYTGNSNNKLHDGKFRLARLFYYLAT